MERFSPSIQILRDAVDRKIILDIEYPVIYNKIMRFLETKGVQFYGDVDEDYQILLSKLEEDLFYYDET